LEGKKGKIKVKKGQKSASKLPPHKKRDLAKST